MFFPVLFPLLKIFQLLRCAIQTAPSQHIINQGEDGDNFYVIEHGLFDVYVNGVHIGAYAHSGSFGELALM
jgi:cAMP-dependent protein kinase regulator